MPLADSKPPLCGLCHDVGWVIVPHPRCVWRGRLVCYPGSRGVATVAVRCSNRIVLGDGYPGLCPAAAVLAGSLVMSWDKYESLPSVGGIDAAELLREYLAEKAARARAGQPPLVLENRGRDDGSSFAA